MRKSFVLAIVSFAIILAVLVYLNMKLEESTITARSTQFFTFSVE